MVKVSAKYVGGLHCELIHEPSRSMIQTDAPKDNQGKGEAFSPTDLVAAALASCTLTTMAIAARKDHLDLKGAKCSVQKEMTDRPPRKIKRLLCRIELPGAIPQDKREKIEAAAKHCPVHRSLNPEIEAPIEFIYIS